MPVSRIVALASAAALLVVLAIALWLEIGARREGFAHIFDRRAAHAEGVLDAREWHAMKAAGDLTSPASGGEECRSDACHRAQAMLGGRWRGGQDCAFGSRYRFNDQNAIIQDIVADNPSPVVRRSYRIVGASVAVPLGQDGAGVALPGTVEKRAGDLEIWTLGTRSYVRRILRRHDQNTAELVLVQSRTGRSGPAATLYVSGRSTAGHGEVTYRRCPDAAAP